MIVKLKLVKGAYEVFRTRSYMVGSIKDMHPDILDVKIYTDAGIRIFHRKRRRQRFYEKYLYKPVQTELKADEESAPVPTV